MPRLFTGLEIPPDIAETLAVLRGGLFNARWIDEEDFHLTLRFLGDVDINTANDFFEELEGVKRPPFSLTFDALSAFGGAHPRAIVAAARGTPALSALQLEHERAARRAGLPPETRKFTPHMTLARLRGISPDAVADYLTAHGLEKPLTFAVDSFALFSAREATGGGPYVVEARFPLTALAQPRPSTSAME